MSPLALPNTRLLTRRRKSCNSAGDRLSLLSVLQVYIRAVRDLVRTLLTVTLPTSALLLAYRLKLSDNACIGIADTWSERLNKAMIARYILCILGYNFISAYKITKKILNCQIFFVSL